MITGRDGHYSNVFDLHDAYVPLPCRLIQPIEMKLPSKLTNCFSLGVLTVVVGVVLPTNQTIADGGAPNQDVLNQVYPGKTYSPYAKRRFPSQVFWGDTHLHTGLSLDAGVFGNTLRPDDAYKLAKGEEIISSTGLPVKLGRPLDWLVVTDHTDLMGIAPDIQQGAPNMLRSPLGKKWHEGYTKGGEEAGKAAGQAARRPQVVRLGKQAHAPQVEFAVAAETGAPAPRHAPA